VLCTDPEGDVHKKVGPNGDLTGCAVSNDASSLSITLEVAGVISDDFQYRVYLEGVMLKYNGGHVTGLPSLTASVDGGTLTFQLDLVDLGLAPDDRIALYAETQGGVPTGPAAGKPDRLPDSGLIGYVIR
jgi:hypothetical protein